MLNPKQPGSRAYSQTHDLNGTLTRSLNRVGQNNSGQKDSEYTKSFLQKAATLKRKYANSQKTS